ncbi:MAG TPA: response regulator [Burkholderiales bacterium]|nr:response regulator [Burkholderiales bacterium]
MDDHPGSAETLAALLVIAGHQAAFTSDSREALELAQRFRPEVAIVDLNMPHIDGYQLAGLFRADNALKDACLVALTAYGATEQRELTSKAGFDAHLVKPFDLQSLKAILKKFDAA